MQETRERALSVQIVRRNIQTHWERIKKSQDESEFSAFIEKYRQQPEGGDWIREAKARLARIRNQRAASSAWQIAKRSNSEVAILEFIRQFEELPEAKQLVSIAHSKLEEIRADERIRNSSRQFLAEIRIDWNLTATSADESAFRQFIEKYDGHDEASPWLTLATQQLSRLNESRRAREAWEKLSKAPTESDLARYVDQYRESPEASRWVNEATSKLDELQNNQITTTINDTLTGDIYADWNRIKLNNDRDSLNAFIERYNPEKRYSEWVSMAKAWLALNKIPREITNSMGMEFVLIPPGKFQMGMGQSGGNRSQDEGPKHEVTISQGFYLGKYEVTQRQWSSVMGQNPSWFEGCFQCPVERVSWFDLTDFIQRLNSMEGDTNYRLPTEAEWEYAALGNTNNESRYGSLSEIAWYLDNSSGNTHEVGRRNPNQYGLYDMLGNVWEWVQDWHGYYETTSQIDPLGPTKGSARVARGCGWVSSMVECRVTVRDSHTSSERHGGLGFRLLRETMSND